jgi:hypothetical protein
MTKEDSSSGSEPQPRGGGFLAFWTTLPGVLTGIATLVTAIVGLVTLLHSLGGSGPSGSPAASASTTAPALVSSVATSTPDTSSSGAAPGAPTHGRLSMVPGDGADLESGRLGNGVANADLSLLGNGVGGHVYELTSLGGPLARISADSVDRAKCVAALSAHSDAYEYLSTLQVGSQLCVQTSENHVAALRVIALPAVGVSQFVFTYTVWQ